MENSSYVGWSNEDDMALRFVGSIEYNHLIGVKGLEEMEKRRRFLGYDKEDKGAVPLAE